MLEQKHETRAKKAKLAITYITIGTLMVVWAIIWLLYLTLPQEISGSVYIASGIILSGISVIVIGMRVGDIGREANVDEEHMETIPKTLKSTSTAKTDPSLAVKPANEPIDVELETRRTANF